jgi:hypothetical protein
MGPCTAPPVVRLLSSCGAAVGQMGQHCCWHQGLWLQEGCAVSWAAVPGLAGAGGARALLCCELPYSKLGSHACCTPVQLHGLLLQGQPSSAVSLPVLLPTCIVLLVLYGSPISQGSTCCSLNTLSVWPSSASALRRWPSPNRLRWLYVKLPTKPGRAPSPRPCAEIPVPAPRPPVLRSTRLIVRSTWGAGRGSGFSCRLWPQLVVQR